MSDTLAAYAPGEITSTNYLYGNHFRFILQGLPDLTFFAQSMNIPSLSMSPVTRPNPFVDIKEVGDHSHHGDFVVNYLVDSAFLTYYSMYNWMHGYSFPHSYAEIGKFREQRKKVVPNPRPMLRELEKTLGILYILQPDTEAILVEVHFIDVFPVAMGQLDFSTTDNDVQILKTAVTFHCTTFEIYLAGND